MSSPLPLLPTEASDRSSHQHLDTAPSSLAVSGPGPSQSNCTIHTPEDEDIRAVSSEMPMYLLAEDEGNEEEIMRLLESLPPSATDPVSSSSIASSSLNSRNDDLPNLQTLNRAHQHRNESATESVIYPTHLQSSQIENSGQPRTQQRVKHGGGWPKGKSRKLLYPPKPPMTGYSIFLADNMAALKTNYKTNSMPVLSRRLSKMWAELSAQQKEVFYSKAKSDRVRYLDELRKYLAVCYTGINLEKANKIINRSFEGETDDEILKCSLCDLHFASLHNKQSHYSGKLHLQALLQRLNELVTASSQSYSETRASEVTLPLQPAATSSSKLREDNESRTVPTSHSYHSTSFTSSVTAVGHEFEVMTKDVAELQAKVDKQLSCLAVLQATSVEAEHFQQSSQESLVTLQEQEYLLECAILRLIRVLFWFPHNS